MRSYTAGQTTALEQRAQIERGLVLFQLGSGNYGFWDGDYPLTWNSITFQPGGQLIEIEAGEQSLAMDSSALTMRLYANPDAGITSSVLRTIEAEAYHQRPVTIYEALFDTDTRARIGDPVAIWRGYIDQIVHETDPSSGVHVLAARCESRSIDYTKRGTAMASNAHQQAISSGDKGFEFAGIAGTVEVAFGRASAQRLIVNYNPQPVL